MSDSAQEKARAKKVLALLYLLIGVGVMLPFVVLWLKR
jgi:hypothetical protein